MGRYFFLTTVSELMPLYEYQCEKCGDRVEQMISAPAVQFKGSGWYVTDYAKKSSAPSSDGGKDSKKEDKSKSEGSSTESSAKVVSSSESSSKESSSREGSTKESTNRVSSSRKPDKRK